MQDISQKLDWCNPGIDINIKMELHSEVTCVKTVNYQKNKTEKLSHYQPAVKNILIKE